jgi:hypothetical protein
LFVYARTDRHYVKKFEEETNLGCHILLDVSASMGYGSGAMTKLEYGSCLAASLAYLMNRQRDAVGLTAFDEGIVTMLPASARPGHLRSVLLTLDRLRLGSTTNVSKPLHQLAETLSKQDGGPHSDLLGSLTRHPWSQHFRFRGATSSSSRCSTTDRVPSTGRRDSDLDSHEYGGAMSCGRPRAAHRRPHRPLSSQLGAVGIDYHLLETSQPLELALLAYLSMRPRDF